MGHISLRKVAIHVVAGLLITTALTAETLDETIERSLPFSPGELLELSNTNGDVVVTAWDRDEIRIEAYKRVRARSNEAAAEALQDLEVRIEETSEGVRIDTRYPHQLDGGWWGGRSTSMSVSYRIQLPDRARLDLETVNGKITVQAVHGAIDLSTTNGGITVDESGGRVAARTTNGTIDVELRQVDEGADLSFKTTNGGITLGLPSNVRASLTARTTNGGIHSDFPITVQGSFGKNRLDGEINGGGGSIELRTTNGGIKIRQI